MRLTTDPQLDRVDRYGRLLAYVEVGRTNVNLELFAAARRPSTFLAANAGGTLPVCSQPERPRRLPAAVSGALARKPSGTRRARYDRQPSGRPCRPSRCRSSHAGTVTRPTWTSASARTPRWGDLDRADVPYRNFRVLAPDPHGFDGRDDDGLGCEG